MSLQAREQMIIDSSMSVAPENPFKQVQNTYR